MAISTDDLSRILRKTLDRAALRRLPESTYRVQFHKGFTFNDATAIVPYLANLGITHLYASPYLEAVPGSTHGYDVIDHNTLNPELGTPADYEALLAALKQHGMSHILDTVPNHMGVATNANQLWQDVLENGPASRYGRFFDITWEGSPRASLHGRVLIPTLGSHYGDVLEKGELKLAYDGGAFAVKYYERTFPISPRAYPKVLSHGLDAAGLDASVSAQLREIITACEALPDRCDGPAVTDERHAAKEQIKQRLAKLTTANDAARQFIDRAVAAFNGTPGDAASFDRLDALLQHQCFRLAYWKSAPDEINYRRFFDVNDLAALAMERPEVFEAAHGFTLDLLAQGKVAGLRVDHPDGLYDPAAYFRRLQAHYLLAVAQQVVQDDAELKDVDWTAVRPPLLERLERDLPSAGDGPNRWPLYVLGEKILAMDEPLPTQWALHGTSGYDFLNMANGLFVDATNAEAFTKLYDEWTGGHTSFEQLVYEKKKLILTISLASELRMLAILLDNVAQRDRRYSDFTLTGLTNALREMIACFPVYRSYITDDGTSDVDVKRIEAATDAAIERNPKTGPAVFHFIRDTLLMRGGKRFSEDDRAAQRRFIGKFQQLTSPTTAKGIEDTSFYIYNRLLSLNEVGGEPSHFGISPDDLHRYFAERQRDWPYAMSTLSTHDTKRSEDVRARLNVLSEIPDEWQRHLQRWGELNAPHRQQVAGQTVPDRNEEYAIYQTLVGAWPIDAGSDAAAADFENRVRAFMVKAMREAKVHTSWTDSNTAYEAAVAAFISKIFDPSIATAFRDDFLAFQRKVNRYGMINGLSQSLIKLTCPGVPDTYQGTEEWDLSLVDPDNRRPVDYTRRMQHLNDTRAALEATPEKHAAAVGQMLSNLEDGRAKQLIHFAALGARRDYPGVFTSGSYQPLQANGDRSQHLFAYARTSGDMTAIVAVPRLVVGLSDDGAPPMGERSWRNTRLLLPAAARGKRLLDVFTNTVHRIDDDGDPSITCAELFSAFPVVLLISQPSQ
ncbi:MAG TPA: malto-oligosyltrehalose synthase [Tepidisphaeraceae bacterium]|jgi:(1->4)-alpha-D-glucan 1-alpha-D-glucosylmutase|nr:malto-oligosyltrehalose synthase [Tepidisphaeraceae bacterium]